MNLHLKVESNGRKEGSEWKWKNVQNNTKIKDKPVGHMMGLGSEFIDKLQEQDGQICILEEFFKHKLGQSETGKTEPS